MVFGVEVGNICQMPKLLHHMSIEWIASVCWTRRSPYRKIRPLMHIYGHFVICYSSGLTRDRGRSIKAKIVKDEKLKPTTCFQVR